MSLAVKSQEYGTETIKCVDSVSVVVANWLVSHADREKADLGDGCTNRAAGRTSFLVQLGQYP